MECSEKPVGFVCPGGRQEKHPAFMGAGMCILNCAWETVHHHIRGARPQCGYPHGIRNPPPLMSSDTSSPYLPLYPNMRKRMQNMMHVTPMWIPMMMPVVEVLLFCSSFMQSHGGFSTAKRKGEKGGQCCYFPIAPPAFGEPT